MITVSEHKTYSIVTITEPKLDSVNSSIIKTECLHILTQKKQGLIINLKHVQFLDSSGLSALLFTYRTAKQHEAPLLFTELQVNPSKIIKIAQLHTIFPIEETLTGAIEKMKSE